MYKEEGGREEERELGKEGKEEKKTRLLLQMFYQMNSRWSQYLTIKN